MKEKQNRMVYLTETYMLQCIICTTTEKHRFDFLGTSNAKGQSSEKQT